MDHIILYIRIFTEYIYDHMCIKRTQTPFWTNFFFPSVDRWTQDLEPWRYNAYMKRLVGRVDEGAKVAVFYYLVLTGQ